MHQIINFTEESVLAEVCKGLPEGEETETWKSKKILTGLGFKNEDMENSPDIFSGGYQMRIELAKVLVSHPGQDRTGVRNICGAMMFPGDNALKKIAVLSGGERSRVLLAKTLLSPSNLLILDEPTHHLDMESCAALFNAVQKYDGAAIVVTHDEYFFIK